MVKKLTAEVIKFKLTTLGELCLLFPIDPLMAKVLLMSSVLGHFEETLKRVSFLSTTESLMNLNFESKKSYYKEKIEIGKSRDIVSDFECWDLLFKFQKQLFHRKALKNISKIETQLFEITQRVSQTKVFFALCKEPVFVHLLLKALKSLEKGSGAQMDALFQMMGTRNSQHVGLLCALNVDVFKALGLRKKFKKKMKGRYSISKVVEYVRKRADKVRRKSKKRRGTISMERVFKESFGQR